MTFTKQLKAFFALALFTGATLSNAAPDYDEKLVNTIEHILRDKYIAWRLGRFLIDGHLIKDPYAPSTFDKVAKAIAEFSEAAVKDIEERVRRGEITSAEGLAQITTSITNGVTKVVWQFVPLVGAYVGTIVGIFVVAYGAKRGFDVLKEWMIMRMHQPQLLREVLYPSHIKKDITDLHYTGNTNLHIKNAIATAKCVVDTRAGIVSKLNPWSSPGRAKFENIMLWGNPGTGKTAIVEIIAKNAGMVLFKTTGGDFAKLHGKDLQQIDELFRRARASRKPVILFIDEMEDLFGSRAQNSLSEDGRKVLSKLLAELSEPSNQIMLIGATNRPEDIDEAMHRRMPQQIQVGLPDYHGRIAILEIYKDKLFNKDTAYSKKDIEQINTALNHAVIAVMASAVGDIAPAELENIMICLKNRSLIFNKGIPTQELIDAVVQEKLAQLEAREHGFVRSSDKEENAEK